MRALGSRSREVAGGGHEGREGMEIRSRLVMGRIRGHVIEYLDALFLSRPSFQRCKLCAAVKLP